MKNHLAIVDIWFKAELTCNILKELQEPFHKDLLYDVKATLANLFGETTTNFSRLGEIAIKNDDPETLGILMWEFQKMYNCELGHFTRDFSPYVLDSLAKIPFFCIEIWCNIWRKVYGLAWRYCDFGCNKRS